MLWPRSSTAAVVCAMLVFLVVMHLVQCSIWSSPGLRCSASWPIWTGRTVSREFGALVVDSGNGLCRAGFAGFSRAVFLFVVVRPKMLRIMAGMHKKDSYAVGWFYWLRCTSRCIVSSCRQAQDARQHGRYDWEGQLPRGVPKNWVLLGDDVTSHSALSLVNGVDEFHVFST